MAFSGSNLYVAVSFQSNISHLTLASNGSPTFAGCIGSDSGCIPTDPAGALTVADGVTSSGQDLYATGSSNSLDGPGSVNQLTLDAAGTPSFDLCVGEKSGCTSTVPAGALDNAGDLLVDGQNLYVTSAYGIIRLTLGSTGAPSFQDCLGDLAGCTATTPSGALDYASGMAISGQNLYVTSPSGNALSHLTVLERPTVTSVVPNAGPVAGTNTVTINGRNFLNSPTVKFGSVAASSVTFVSSNELKVVAPAMAAGIVHVTVTTPGGTNSATNGSLYADGPPVVSSLGPISGVAGSTVTISGSRFVPHATVKFGTHASPKVTFISATELKATVPNGAVSSKVSVSDPAGTGTSSQRFTVTP